MLKKPPIKKSVKKLKEKRCHLMRLFMNSIKTSVEGKNLACLNHKAVLAGWGVKTFRFTLPKGHWGDKKLSTNRMIYLFVLYKSCISVWHPLILPCNFLSWIIHLGCVVNDDRQIGKHELLFIKRMSMRHGSLKGRFPVSFARAKPEVN